MALSVTSTVYGSNDYNNIDAYHHSMHHLPPWSSASLVSGLDFFDFGRSHLLALTSLKAFITSKPTPRPKANTTVNITRGQSGVKSLKDIGMRSIVSSSVKGARSGTLLSPDVHTKDNRLVEKKIRDQDNQTAGSAKKSHIFQYGGVEV